MFSCEFCEISQNTFFHRVPLVAASDKKEIEKNASIRVAGSIGIEDGRFCPQ